VRRLRARKIDADAVKEMNAISKREPELRSSIEMVDAAADASIVGAVEGEGEDHQIALDIDGDGIPDLMKNSQKRTVRRHSVTVNISEEHLPANVKKRNRRANHPLRSVHACIAKCNREVDSAVGCTPVPLIFDFSFDLLIMCFIVVNTFTMMITFFGMPNDYTQTLNVINLIFAGIFTIEALLKLMVFGVWGYFQHPANIFDFVIVVATLFGIFMDLIGASLGNAATVIRTIRILRVVRIFNGFRELRIIIDAITFAIPYVVNICILLFLIVSIFSVLFMQIFGKVGFIENGLDVHANFQDFPTAAITLIRIAMGEGWPDILMNLRWGPGTARGNDFESRVLDALSGPKDGCTRDPPHSVTVCGFEGAPLPESSESCIPLDGCGRGMLADICLIIYLMVIWLVMLNLLVFYVVLFFSQSKDEAEDPKAPQNAMTNQQQSEFYEAWTIYDPLCSGHIRPRELDLFFGSLPRPLGFRPDSAVMNQSLVTELAASSVGDDGGAESELRAAATGESVLEERYCLIPHDEIHRRVMSMDWPLRNGRKQPAREAADGSGLRVSIEDVNIVISKLAISLREKEMDL
jgi:hypothetical protein